MNGDGLADLTVGALGENNGNGAVTALRSDGTQIAGGGYFLSVSRVGVSTAGTPLFGVNFAG